MKFFILSWMVLFLGISSYSQDTLIVDAPNQDIVRPRFKFGDDSLSKIIYMHMKDIKAYEDTNFSKIYSFIIYINQTGKIINYKSGLHSNTLKKFNSNLKSLIYKINYWSPAYFSSNQKQILKIYKLEFLNDINANEITIMVFDQDHLPIIMKDFKREKQQ